jgi:hypothetical protein
MERMPVRLVSKNRLMMSKMQETIELKMMLILRINAHDFNLNKFRLSLP